MKIHFQIEAGFLNRSGIRRQLENSKAKLQHWYPGCRALLTEDRGLFESRFHFEAAGLPDSAERHMKEWLQRLKDISDRY